MIYEQNIGLHYSTVWEERSADWVTLVFASYRHSLNTEGEDTVENTRKEGQGSFSVILQSSVQ